MKNWVSKNRHIFFLLILIISNNAKTQTCSIVLDSSLVSKINYINVDSLDFNNDFFVMLLSRSISGTYYYKVFKDSEGCYFEYGDKSGNLFRKEISEKVSLFDKTKNLESMYVLSSEFSKEYFDMLIIKIKDRYIQIIPIGSTIYGNFECIKTNNSVFGEILIEFEFISNKYYRKIKPKKVFIPKPELNRVCQKNL